MDGIPDNRFSHNIFDAFLRMTKSQPRPSALHNIMLPFRSRKKLLALPAVGILAIGIPIAAAESFSSPSANPGRTSASPSSGSSNVNHQEIKFQQKSSSSDGSIRHETSLTVNGQPVPVPENGHIEQTFSDGSQSTTIQVDNQSHQSASGGSSSNTSSSSVNTQSNTTNEYRGSP
jgi:hypothetical protein